jgi:hypothetical protein
MLRKNESVAEELDLEELIFDLHESGIHILIQTSNVGMMLTITDGLSRIRAEHLIERPIRDSPANVAALWLHSQALALFPNCEYACRHSARRQ